MNGYINSGIAARNEIEQMSGVHNWVISYSNSAPVMGQIDDSIIGMFEFTRSGVQIDKYHAMLIFANSTYLPDFSDYAEVNKSDINGGYYSGRDLISKVLEETPINYSRPSQFYNPNYANYIDYDPTEINAQIVQGKHIGGVLDKKAVGKGASGGIYHIIEREYGAERALEVMFNMQQLTIGYIYQFGYSIGIMDLLMSPSSIQKIHEIESAIINESELITERLNSGEIIPPIGKTVEEFYEEQQIAALSVMDDFAEPIFESINPRVNSLYKLVACGSKGSLGNIFHIVSAIGQIRVNGQRPRQNFSYKRSLAYFPRFDTRPESRGYITNSYLSGITSAEFIFGAMNARFDFISKALLTSVTGEQNRKSIKNLESIIVNNFRMAVKGNNIIQLLYGENGIDPRRIERVKFPTIMISDKDLEDKYHFKPEGASNEYVKAFDEEFSRLKSDRDDFRRIFLKIEASNTRELLDDTKFMPVNLPRIIDDILNKYSDVVSKISNKYSAERLAEINECIEYVKNLCDGIPYVLINEIQEKRKSKIPEHIKTSTHLLCILIRSYLCSAKVLSKINLALLKIICDKIRIKFAQSLVDYGAAVGIIAAQSFSGPLTQYMLDSHHRTVSGGTSTSGMVKTKEVLGAKSVDQMEAPVMLLALTPEIERDPAKVQEIVNNIEVMPFIGFVTMWQIFFEKFGEPIHPKYVNEKSMIADFQKYNPLLKAPGDLIKWCIRIVLNKTTLILKNMSLETIVNKLRETYPDLYIVYTPENASQIILRIYIRNTMFKGAIEEDNVRDQVKILLDTVIRGVPGIQTASVTKLLRHKIAEDGSVVRDNDKYGITTLGSNMPGVLGINGIDPLTILTDSHEETSRMLGIEASRARIIEQIKGLGSGDTGYAHLSIYADEMTYTGRITGIERSGLATREVNNVLLRLGFTSPIQTLEEAGINAMEDKVSGITAPLLLGTTPNYGTKYNSFHLNEEMIATNIVKGDTYLDLL